jgi:dTDP-4-amino-4,6-dideoxygalactose transaminase
VLNTSSAYCAKRSDSGVADNRFVFERVGFSAKMNELEAAVGIGNLDVYAEILGKRRENLYYLMERFEPFRQYLATIGKEDHEEIGPHAFPMIVQEKARFTRDDLTRHLWKHEIDTRTLFSSMPTQCAGFGFLGYRPGDFPNSEYIGDNGIHIGVHQEIGKRECDHVLRVVEEFLEKNA